MNDIDDSLPPNLEWLLATLEDTDPAFFVLNTLLYAAKNGRVDELEEAITPLVDRWLAESVNEEAATTLNGYRP